MRTRWPARPESRSGQRAPSRHPVRPGSSAVRARSARDFLASTSGSSPTGAARRCDAEIRPEHRMHCTKVRRHRQCRAPGGSLPAGINTPAPGFRSASSRDSCWAGGRSPSTAAKDRKIRRGPCLGLQADQRSKIVVTGSLRRAERLTIQHARFRARTHRVPAYAS